MIKIIFSDMDGTLLTGEGKLPNGFDEIISLLKSRGVIFSPASGRQYYSLLKTFAKYENEFLFLGDNGTFVMQGGKEIFSIPVEISVVERVLKATESFKNILRVWCGKKNAYILKSQDLPGYTVELEKYYTRTVAVDNWSEIDDTPIKIAFFDGTGHSKENIYNHLTEFHDTQQVVLSSDYWVDVSSKNASKGAAVKKIQQILNFKPEECAAFGDFMNDYEMLQAVEYSFAMANAYPEIKKVAKFETLSNDDFGVIAGIEKLISDGLI